MSDKDSDIAVQMIPIENITVVNPRGRGEVKFRQIIANIGKIGLKKPITVSRREGRNGHTQYDLVCGQGRLEAYKAHGQTEVPAIVVSVSHEELLIMSLAENLARKRYTAVELAQEIGTLRERGHTFPEIARKTDLAVEYVKGIARLLEKGERRLLSAVEAGQIPITIAITIASSDDAAVQRALTEAYESNSLRGKSLLKARQLIELRKHHGKLGGAAVKDRKETVTAQNIIRTFQTETNKHRQLVQKAKVAENRLLFVVSALRSLLADDHFRTLLRAELLTTIPEYLAGQIKVKGL